MHQSLCVDGKDSQSRIPGIAVGTKAYALRIAGTGGAVLNIASVLIEVVIEQQVVFCLRLLNISDMLVAVVIYLLGCERIAPDTNLINLSLEASLAHGDSLQSRHASRNPRS